MTQHHQRTRSALRDMHMDTVRFHRPMFYFAPLYSSMHVEFDDI